MFLRPHQRSKDGKDHTYWSLVETVRTANGPRQRTLCYLGELNGSAEARWLKSVEVFNEQGEAQQLKLFPSHVEVPDDDPQVARVLVNRVRLERTRQFGACFLGWELWKHLELDGFFEQAVDDDPADVAWSRVAAVLAINRLCAPDSELAVEERWYPATALDDLLEIEEGKINDTRLYRCLDRILPHKTKLEQHLKQRYGELFGAEFDVLLYDLTSTYVEGAAEKNPMMFRGYSRDHRPDCEQMVIALIVNSNGGPLCRRSGLLPPRPRMALEKLSLSVEMEGHRPCAKKQQNLVGPDRTRVYTLSTCPWRRDEFAVCESNGLDSGVA
jgi:hypothetical protein